MVPKISHLAVIASAALLLSCTKTGSTGESGVSSLLKSSSTNFRLSLVDKPSEEVSHVFVNIKYAELILAKGGKQARVKVAEGLGEVDLLELRNGVKLPMADLAIPEGIEVSQIRLILEDSGNYLVYPDNRTCDLRTPSAQKSGIKLLIHKTVRMEKGFDYEVVVDFDVDKSIVLQGNGGCLLKPVLKLKSATQQAPGEEPSELPGDDRSDDQPADDPWDPVDSPDLPPDVPPQTIPEYFNG